MIQWTETADFCGRCHTMAPELEAYHAGSHRDVACGECHVEPGIAGWVKAKLAGTRQLVGVVTGTLPHPDPPARPRAAARAPRTPARSATRSNDALVRRPPHARRPSARTRRTRASSWA